MTGLPSDDAVLALDRARRRRRPVKVHKVTIGFQAVAALLARRSTARPRSGTPRASQLQRQRPGIREFRVDDFGAPPYPELVLCVSRRRCAPTARWSRRRCARCAAATTKRCADPESAVEALVERAHGLDRADTERELDAVSPAFTEARLSVGELDPAKLRAWAQWEARFGIVKRPPNVALAFAPGF